MSEGFSFFIILIIYIVGVVLRAARKKKGASSTAAKTVPAAKSPAPIFSKRRGHKDDDCEYGEINHQYSHASERRVAQLQGYLEAGLIDKKEYAQMLERYTRQDQIYSDYNN